MSSSTIVEVCTIDDIIPHDNADKLEVAKIKGWFCITQKGLYKAGDKVVYVPPEFVMPKELAEKLGVTNYLRGGNRVKTIKLRGTYSEGLIVPIGFLTSKKEVGDNVAADLGIVKYVPKTRISNPGNSGPVKRQLEDERFKKYTDIENFKHYSKVMENEEEIVITEKVHGSNCRFCNLLNDNWLWRILGYLFGMKQIIPRVGSHNVMLSDPRKSKFFDGEVKNTYWAIALQYLDKLPVGYQVFGEVYGAGVQWLTYDAVNCKKFAAFDVMYDGEYLSYDDFISFCSKYGIPTVPELYRRKFDEKKIHELANSQSSLNAECMREGVVIKPTKETRNPKLGRVILKYISEQYREYVDRKNKEDVSEEDV